MLVGDFNAEESESYILKFLYEYYTKTLLKIIDLMIFV